MKTVINIVCAVIPIPSIRRQLRKKWQDKWWARINNLGVFANMRTGRPVMLWIDHALGGGTEVYSKRQFKKLHQQFDIMRLQYFPNTEMYHLTDACRPHRIFKTQNVDTIFDFFKTQNITEIVVNNLVAYKNALGILQAISDLKHRYLKRVHVSVRGHDFHSICPSFNLVNCDGVYCNLGYCGGCEVCWGRKKLADNPISHNVLKSGATTVAQWRTKWADFLENTADEIILFSNAIEKIFIRAYPSVANKIKIIPHDVRKYRPVKIRKHRGINIAVLGNISHQKGADVIRAMATIIPDDVNIIVIGKMKNAPGNIYVHGTYRARTLPRLMKKYNVDVVFIPSIWPETFSYTTSEAISMQMPIVCFDLGAPAERVAMYERGMVLDEIAPEENLGAIIRFAQQQKEQTR